MNAVLAALPVDLPEPNYRTCKWMLLYTDTNYYRNKWIAAHTHSHYFLFAVLAVCFMPILFTIVFFCEAFKTIAITLLLTSWKQEDVIVYLNKAQFVIIIDNYMFVRTLVGMNAKWTTWQQQQQQQLLLLFSIAALRHHHEPLIRSMLLLVGATHKCAQHCIYASGCWLKKKL